MLLLESSFLINPGAVTFLSSTFFFPNPSTCARHANYFQIIFFLFFCCSFEIRKGLIFFWRCFRVSRRAVASLLYYYPTIRIIIYHYGVNERMNLKTCQWTFALFHIILIIMTRTTTKNRFISYLLNKGAGIRKKKLF